MFLGLTIQHASFCRKTSQLLNKTLRVAFGPVVKRQDIWEVDTKVAFSNCTFLVLSTFGRGNLDIKGQANTIVIHFIFQKSDHDLI